MKLKIFLIFALFSASVFAQLKNDGLSGNLRLDSQISIKKAVPDFNKESGKTTVNKKSVFIAAGLSVLMPGAGQFYNGDYLKSALFFATEVAAITVGVIYDKKGDDETAVFESYAQQHWSVARYALWTITNLKTLNGSLDPNDYSNLFADAAQTKVNWAVLNKLENDIGGYYSHRLAHFGEQQYYEMIGKYPQFNPGWDDFGDEHTPFKYGDDVTPRYHHYSDMRGKANSFYNVMNTAVIIVIVNHVISAVESAWSANKFNKKIESKVTLRKANVGFAYFYYPELNIRVNF
jgi:hypothetical protein